MSSIIAVSGLCSWSKMIVRFISIVHLFLLFLCSSCAEPIVHVWHNRSILPIEELAIVHGHEFPNIDFDPPLNVRKDGSLFLSVTVVDSDAWINIALNSFVSLAKFQNVSGLTIMTMNDEKLGSVFRKLGLFTYDAKATIATFPADFRLEKPLPSWSWGAIIFLRFNAWFEAFRRGIGFCSIDTDVTYNHDVFFVKSHNHNQQYVDIATQGRLEAIAPGVSNDCQYQWTQKFNNKFGYYINPGFACHAYNERTLKFMQDLQKHIELSISHQIYAWGQPAYHMNFCENDFEYHSTAAAQHRWYWKGNLKRHNISVAMFTALAPPTDSYTDGVVTMEERPHVPAYHAKACHGADMGDTVNRVKCKEDWLKEQGQWFLPEGLPRGLDAWLSLDDATVATLKALLHPMN